MPRTSVSLPTTLPGPEIVRDVVASLQWLQDATHDDNITFEAAIEGELENSLLL